MKTISKIFYFLGSLYFALTLIALTAAFVAAGTFLEAHTESHLFSAAFTYQNPFFQILIWGFFLNILLSALRRWPFKFKHLPFLITHLGLLMLLAGVIIKGYFGTQGSLNLMEGGASNRIFLANTYALSVEKKDPIKNSQQFFSLDKLFKQKIKFDDVEIRLVDYSPHSQERKQTWIKNQQAVILGLPPIPVRQIENEEITPVANNPIHFHHEKSTPWKVFAIATHQVGDVAKKVYLKGLYAQISNSKDGEVYLKVPLLEALNRPVLFKNYTLNFSLDWNFSSLQGQENPTLNVEMNHEKMAIPLSGPESLFNNNLTSSFRGKLPLTIDLIREEASLPESLFLLIQDEHEDDHLFFFNSYGQIHSNHFKNDNLQSVVAYDGGFGGYVIQTAFPFEDYPNSRLDKEQAELFRIAIQLRENLKMRPNLSPPLAFLKKTTDKAGLDFTETLLNFLQAWDSSSQLIYHSRHPIANQLDWNQMSQEEQNAFGWLCFLLNEMESELIEKKNFAQLLQDKGWPLTSFFDDLEDQDMDRMVALFTQQLFSAAAQLPKPRVMPENMSEEAFSIYLKLFGITLNNLRHPSVSPKTVRHYHAARIYHDQIRKILAPLDEQPTHILAQLIESMPEESSLFKEIKKAHLTFKKQSGQTIVNDNPTCSEIGECFILNAPLNKSNLSTNEFDALMASLDAEEIILETPLTIKQKKMHAINKWEDNHPLATLEIKKGRHKEYCTLSYDKYGSGLAWPVLDGFYVLRFQPLFVDIPYKVRLHDARQINYPGTSQAYSYESDILVTDLRDKTQVEKTISMNNVHETADGYRFYLSSLSPPHEVTAQRVQIVVNHDPAKYFLTYPGALILSLGIFLLFWLKPYKKQ